MRYGIAIFENDPGLLIKDFIVEANLAKLPLSILAFESQGYIEMAENLELEKIGLVTVRADMELEETKKWITSRIDADRLDRLYIRTLGKFTDIGPILELYSLLFKYVKRLGFISPIGELYRDKSITRQIIALNTRSIEYVPMMSYFPNIPVSTLEMIRKNNGRDLTVVVLPLDKNPELVLKWIDDKLAPNGVEAVIYPSLFYAKPNLFPEESDMVTKRKYTRKSTKKEIPVPVYPGEPTSSKVVTLFPIAKRSTPSLNAMILGSCSAGDELEIVKIVTPVPGLVFAETKQGFFICTHSNKVDYVRFIE